MRVVYALPLLIGLGFAWLALRYVLERRRRRALRDRLQRAPRPPKLKSRGDSERSEMRAYEDATTVARTIKQKEEPEPASQVRGVDGTRSVSKL